MKNFKLFWMNGNITTAQGISIEDALANYLGVTQECKPNDCADLKWYQEVSNADGLNTTPDAQPVVCVKSEGLHTNTLNTKHCSECNELVGG